MEFQTLRKSNTTKKVVIALILFIALGVTILMLTTRAKYKLVESVPLANGTINYTLVDFELAGIKVKKDGSEDYVDADTIEDNYVLNEEDSYCTEKYSDDSNSFRDVQNDSLTINFDKENKTISVKPYSKKGTKCYLFFDEHNPSEDTLANMGITQTKGTVDGFTGTSCNSGCDLQENGIYEAEDDFGTSYYYRGTVDNNWVVFGKEGSYYIWWRIIRINGNGTIRLIYAGTSSSNKNAPSPTGLDTMIRPRQTINSSYPRAVRFNINYNDNKYVGYMFGGTDGEASTSYEQAHKSDAQSTILQEIVDWYNNKTNLGELSSKIDVDTGFCGDRTYTETNHGSSYPGTGDLGWKNTATVYGAEKVWQTGNTSWNSTEQTPTLKCGKADAARKRDLYTGPSATEGGTKGTDGNVEGNNALPVPVGLITMDEVIYAGGFGGHSNRGYWLSTDQYYWTMSPNGFTGDFATVSVVQDFGALSSHGVHGDVSGVRPVINLKAGTKITTQSDGGEGSRTNPYVVGT